MAEDQPGQPGRGDLEPSAPTEPLPGDRSAPPPAVPPPVLPLAGGAL